MKVRARRSLDVSPAAVWTTVRDPARMARWWPRVARIEGASRFGFTQVLVSKRGREVRADFHVTGEEKERRRSWELELRDTPFARVFASSEHELRLDALDEGRGTRVTLQHEVRLRGLNRLGAMFVWRSTRTTLREALDGLEAEVRRSVAEPEPS